MVVVVGAGAVVVAGGEGGLGRDAGADAAGLGSPSAGELAGAPSAATLPGLDGLAAAACGDRPRIGAPIARFRWRSAWWI